jgi:hypothetical protein
MRAKQVIGWVLLLAGAIYGISKAEPFLDRIRDNGLAGFGIFLIILIIILAVARILNS